MRENNEERSVTVEVDAVGAVAGALDPTPKIWQPLAHFHLYSARVLCKKAVEVEALYDGSQQSREALTDEYMGGVTGSIFTAVAFLEALINETFLRAVADSKGSPLDDVLQKLPSDSIASIASAWENGIDWGNEPSLRQFLTDKYSNPPLTWWILDKYQLALYLADKPSYSKPFKKGEKLLKNIALLKVLRNSLMHPTPEWIAFPPKRDPYEAETKKTTNLLRELEKRKFTNALYPGQGSIFTLLGSKCASWAVSSSMTLAKEFRDRMPLDLSSIVGL